MTTELVKQPTNRPIRKVKFAGIAAALLTVVTYAVSAAQGEAVISQQAALDAVVVLLVGGVPVVTSWFTKSSSTDQ